MPIAAASRCPRCGHLQRARGLCSACRRTGRYTAPDAKRIYNSRAWRALRDQVLSEEPVCRNCRVAGRLEVDHIITIAKAPWLALVRSNLQALCPPCHAIKTRCEAG